MRARWYWLLAAAAALAAALVWVWRAPLVEALLRQGLAASGGELVALDGLRLERGVVALDHLRLRLPDGAEQAARHLLLRYRLRGGLSLRLRVEELQLALPQRAATGADSPPPPSASLPLHQVARWWSTPLEELLVERLTVAPQPAVRLHWTREGTLRRLEAQRGDHRLAVRLDAPGDGALLVEAQWDQGAQRLARLDGRLQAGEAGVAVTANAAVAAGPLQWLLPAIGWRGLSGDLQLSLQQTLPLDVAQWPQAPWRAPLRLSLRADAIDAAAARFGATELRLQGMLEWSAPELSLRVKPGQWWQSAALAVGALRLREPGLQVSQPALLRWQAASGVLALELPAAQLRLPEVVAAPWRLQAALQVDDLALQRRGGSAALALQGRLSSRGLRLSHPRYRLPVLALDGSVTLRESALRLRGELASDRGRRLLQVDLRHRLDSGTGRASLATGPQRFGTGADSLREAFSGWQWPLDIRAGTSETDVDLDWAPRQGGRQLRGRFQQRLAGLGGYYGEVALVGLDADVAGEFIAPDYLVIADGAWASLASLDVGVPLDDVHIALRGQIGSPWGGEGERRMLHLQRFEAGLLGGRIHAGEYRWRAGQPARTLPVKFEGLRLENLLSALGSGVVQATGTVRGELPLRLEGRSLTVRAGRLGAEPPGGVIHYRPPTAGPDLARPDLARPDLAASGSAALQRVVEQALANYHYQALEGDVDYAGNGDLHLRLRMDGHNPDMNNGQPIRLNLSLHDNVPTLLRSLQAGRKIEELVDRRIRGGADGVSPTGGFPAVVPRDEPRSKP